MSRLRFTEIDAANSTSGDSDQFEKFSKLFFKSVEGVNVVTGPTRGADGGIDLCVESVVNGNKVRKLVSCKHYAHSKKSVGRNDEIDIPSRLKEHNCSVFIGFYSTIASSSLEEKLKKLRENEGIEYELYNSEDIEDKLLNNYWGFELAKRFFPRSIQNVWPQVISLRASFTEKDAIKADDGNWYIPDVLNKSNIFMSASTIETAVRLANEHAMSRIHQPMFLAAWKDAVRCYPTFFEIPQNGIDSAETIKDLAPKWNSVSQLDHLSPNPRWSLLAIWSLVDASRVREILRNIGRDASQQDKDLMSFQSLAYSTGTDRRDILTRLFAYHSL